VINIEYVLYHHGIKGMKWGVRRFRKKDGSLTPAGKKRYYDTPELNKQKSDLERVKVARATADLDKNRAYNTYSINPTSKNWDTYKKKLADYEIANATYKRAKLKYSTDKEAARIQEKGITFKRKSKHRQKLEEQYKKMGMSDEQAQAAANKRIRTEKILAASAALTVGACAAYIAVKSRKNKIDGIIKAGETLQRVEMKDTGGKLHDVFYAAKGDHDMKRYEGLLGATRKKQTGHAYLMKLRATADIKVASKDKAASIFGELYKNDPAFKLAVAPHVKQHFRGGNTVKDINNLSKRNIKKMYENFNSDLIDLRETGADKKFYSKLKSAGYGAIQDINDMKFSGYNAKNPLIVFDNAKNKSGISNIMVRSVNELTGNLDKREAVEAMKVAGEISTKQFIERFGVLSAASLTGATVVTYVSDPKNYDTQGGTSKWD
jgi:hypothetical protein